MFDEIVKEFAELNLQIIKNIKTRGYSHADKDTLATVRENILVLKDLRINIDTPETENAKTGD